jgi:hypothetical protein
LVVEIQSLVESCLCGVAFAEQREAAGEFPADWNQSKARCGQYCHNLNPPAWCAFPAWASVAITFGAAWVIMSVVVVCCWIRKRSKLAEPFSPLNEF